MRVCGHGSNRFLRPKIAGVCWPIVADRNRPLKHVRRAHVVLCSADRLPVQEVARGASVSRPAVWCWQARYAEQGVVRPAARQDAQAWPRSAFGQGRRQGLGPDSWVGQAGSPPTRPVYIGFDRGVADPNWRGRAPCMGTWPITTKPPSAPTSLRSTSIRSRPR